MGVDADFAGILREIVQFLESLCDIDLPLKIENARENLLQRSRTKLSTFASSRDSMSPEPYLEMNAGKGLLLFANAKEIEIEEYVGVEEQPPGSPPNQDYYESFQEVGTTINDNKTTGRTETTFSSRKIAREEGAEDKLIEIYKTFTPAMTMNKAHKFGPLGHKVERKSFGFVRGNIRPCWIGLVGSHLLIYGSEKDKQPPEICSIRGYMGRPAANATFKDQEHAKSAFEIFCPGNKTLQFIAKTSREMEEWLAAISRTNLSIQDRDSGMYERSMDEKVDAELLEEPATEQEEKYQDVGELLLSPKREEPVVLRATSPARLAITGTKVTRSNSEKKKELIGVVPSFSPPALPVRLPRRLPSLPHEAALTPSYEPLGEGYEEDDIYHKIEDFRESGRSYENVTKKSSKRVKEKKAGKKKEEKKKKKKSEDTAEVETYDDVENKQVESKKSEAKKKRRLSLFQESPPKKTEEMETYDDVQAVAQDAQNLVCSSRSPRRDVRDDFEAPNERNARSSLTAYDDVLQPSSIVSTDSNDKTEDSEAAESKDAAATSPTKSPTKSPQRRWFLDRVRHRKDSPKKEEKKRVEGKKPEKKGKRKVSLESTTQTCVKTVEPDLPSYDDVSDYLNDLNSQNASHPENQTAPTQVTDVSNYNYPPPPRPVYVKPPKAVVASSTKKDIEIIEDLYDDIANYRDDNNIEIEESTQVAKTTINFVVEKETKPEGKKAAGGKQKINGDVADKFESTVAIVSAVIGDETQGEEIKLSVDTEHYQTPRKDSPQVNPAVVAVTEQEEQLYDDVAILAEFRARQRNSSSSSSSHDVSGLSSISATDKMTNGAKKPWNPFGSGKKTPMRDFALTQTTTTVKNRSSADRDDLNEPGADKTDPAKPNKLQKLINKMESTLGKQPSAKSLNPLSSKTHNGE